MKIQKLQLAIMAVGLAGVMSASAVTLTFNEVSPDGQNYVVAVPEPTTTGCFLLGLGALICVQRFAQNRRS